MSAKRSAVLVAALAMAAPLIVHFEGRSLVAYLDPVGVPTICEGVTPGVQLGDVATPEECDAQLNEQMQRTLDGLTTCINVDLTANQWAALTSWTYNVGVGAACHSTLVRLANAGAPPSEWCPEVRRWVYAGGQVLRGLELRRAAEYEICMAGGPRT